VPQAPAPSFLTETWGWIVFASELGALCLTPRILLGGKPPGSTFAWLLGVWLMPVFGPLLFLLIGRDRLSRGLPRRKRRSDAQTRSELDRAVRAVHAVPADDPGARRVTLPEPWAQLARVATQLTDASLTAGNRVDLLSSAAAMYERLLDDIASAKRQIHLEFYIWRDDATGSRFVEALCRRASAGVEVRLLLDAVGSLEVTAETRARLAAAGAAVGFFHPVNPLRRRFNVNLRNHRKIAVLDGTIAYTGGINVGDEYLGLSDEVGPWRDTAVRLVGPATAELQRIFCEDWYFTTDELVAGEPAFPELPRVEGGAPVQVVASGPDEDFGYIHRTYFCAVGLARRSILITTPYFVPDAPMQLALETAALRGVDVQLIVPRHSDNPVVDAAARSYVRQLAEAGVRIHFYERGFIHAKTIVVDGQVAAVGSANMDVRSFRLNFEAGVLVYDDALARELVEAFERDLLACSELRAGDRAADAGVARQSLDALARLLSPVL